MSVKVCPKREHNPAKTRPVMPSFTDKVSRMNPEPLLSEHLVFQSKYPVIYPIILTLSKLDIYIELGEGISMHDMRLIHVHFTLISLFSIRPRIEVGLITSSILAELLNSQGL